MATYSHIHPHTPLHTPTHPHRNKSIKVHSSPTPSRRSTDYADLNSINPTPSLSAPSVTDSLPSRNGRYPPTRSHIAQQIGHMMPNGNSRGFIDDPNDVTHMYPPDELDYPISDMESTNGEFRGQSVEFRGDSRFHIREPHVRHLSGGVSQSFVDTLNRVHTPPPPSSPSRCTLSQETSDSWTPADNLNHRGHMTNNPMSRSSSNRSSQNAALMTTPQKSDLGRTTGPLSPVHEQSLHYNGPGPLTRHNGPGPLTEQVLHNNTVRNGISLQEFPPRSHSIHQSRTLMQGDNNLHSMRARSHSAANNLHVQQPGMELGTMTSEEIQRRNLPPIPVQQRNTSPPPDSHTVEYSSIPPVHMMRTSSNSNRPNHYPPPTTSPPIPREHFPPPPQFRHSPELEEEHYKQPTDHHNGSRSRMNYPPVEIQSQPAPTHFTAHTAPPPAHTTRSPSPVYTAPQVCVMI